MELKDEAEDAQTEGKTLDINNNNNIDSNNNNLNNYDNQNNSLASETVGNKVSVACQTEPNLIDKLIDRHIKKQPREGEYQDLYQEYVRSAQCAQFWPLDNNPIRSLVPSMVKVDLPEQYLRNESLMFDLVQAISNNCKLVNLLAKYIHHIVPNVIISKRIDLIPLITCTIRVCRDTSEQERLISLLFNLIKRPNEEQRRMILSGIVVVLQVSPHQSSSLLLPNLWDHVNDKFPERRILLAESCATMAHYVRPAMRTNLILSILIQLLKDKNAAVRSAACKSFACLLTLIMDRNDEVFDACLSATEDIIQDVMQQTPVNFCEHRYELEQMRFCAIETVYPLLSMWSVKLGRFKVELAEFYLCKAEKYFTNLLNQPTSTSATNTTQSSTVANGSLPSNRDACESAGRTTTARRRSQFLEQRHSSSFNSSSGSSSFFQLVGGAAGRRQSAYLTTNGLTVGSSPSSGNPKGALDGAQQTSQRAVGAYLRMLNYLIPFVFSDAVHSCAWLSKSSLHLATNSNEQLSDSQVTMDADLRIKQNTDDMCPPATDAPPSTTPSVDRPEPVSFVQIFDRPLNFANKLLDPTLIIDESAIVAFHDQLERDHMMIESLDWIMGKFLPKLLAILANLSHRNFHSSIGATSEIIQELLSSSIASIRQLSLLFGKHLTRSKIRPFIKQHIQNNQTPSLFAIYLASLTAFEPIEQQEFEEIVLSIRQNLSVGQLTRNDVEILALSIKIIATNTEQIHSPSTRQKFLTYILDALVSYSNQMIRTNTSTTDSNLNAHNKPLDRLTALKVTSINVKVKQNSKGAQLNEQQQQTQTKEFMLIIFRHILTCLIEPKLRPTDWAHILVTKFLPLLISLANDSADVYVCTYARLMCAQLVETFDTYLDSPKLTRQTADAMMPALASLKGLTEQIKASNLRRQIESLSQDLNEKFFKDINNNNNDDADKSNDNSAAIAASQQCK